MQVVSHDSLRESPSVIVFTIAIDIADAHEVFDQSTLPVRVDVPGQRINLAFTFTALRVDVNQMVAHVMATVAGVRQ
jgi:hypothetical protein